MLLHGVKAATGSPCCAGRSFSSRRASGSILFDFQAHGESAGKRITFGRLEGLDAAAAVAFVRERLPGERVAAVGSSLGGAAALLGPRPAAGRCAGAGSGLPGHRHGDCQPHPGRSRPRGRRCGGAAHGIAVRAGAAAIPRHEPGRPPSDRSYRARHGAAPDRRRHPRRSHDHGRGPLRCSERAPEPKSLWSVEGAGHFDLEGYAPDAYRARVLPFLVERLRAPAR